MFRKVLNHLYGVIHHAPVRPMLGRWALKDKSCTESIVVLNANRDHCGDALCGNPKEYKKLSRSQSDEKKRQGVLCSVRDGQ